MSPERMTQLMPGALLGPYEIQSPLGAGGMGDVYRAVDTRLGRAVAIKTCHEQFSERFSREARAIASLNHPHICTLYDVGPNYLVMELVEGESLAGRLKRGKLPIEQTIEYGSQIADALAAAHAKGIIHRDLKPQNIMLTKSGVKVLDFGLARSPQDETRQASARLMGTSPYFSMSRVTGSISSPRLNPSLKAPLRNMVVDGAVPRRPARLKASPNAESQVNHGQGNESRCESIQR
jgi:serine/threonine protein kinase